MFEHVFRLSEILCRAVTSDALEDGGRTIEDATTEALAVTAGIGDTAHVASR